MEKIKNIKLPNGEVYELGGSGLDGKITNCITEIPQRIKYTLENGTLTIKAGSVVIVPYGTTDRTSEFPVGATFINDNFKVYDTQFEDGKFFVWAEVQNNISGTRTTTDTNTRFITLYVHANSVDGAINSASGTSITTSALFYNTSTNLIEYLTNGANTDGNLAAFPLGISKANGTNKFATIQQIFNGFGYIGSTVWADKGVKTLLPNGRNEDGTLKNIEYTPPKILMYDLSKNFHVAQPVTFIIENDNTFGAVTSTDYLSGYTLPSTVSSQYYHLFYNIGENKHYRTSGSTTANWKEIPKCVFGNAYFDGTNITNFNTKLPFKAVDYSEALIRPKGFGSVINVSSGWTATSNGIVDFYGYSDSKGNYMLGYIDGQRVYQNGQSGSNANHHDIAVSVPVYKGQVITYTGAGFIECKFYSYSY